MQQELYSTWLLCSCLRLSLDDHQVNAAHCNSTFTPFPMSCNCIIVPTMRHCLPKPDRCWQGSCWWLQAHLYTIYKKGLHVCGGRHGLLKCGFVACVPEHNSKLFCIVQKKRKKHQSTHKAAAYRQSKSSTPTQDRSTSASPVCLTFEMLTMQQA